jgi:hypothetical protein
MGLDGVAVVRIPQHHLGESAYDVQGVLRFVSDTRGRQVHLSQVLVDLSAPAQAETERRGTFLLSQGDMESESGQEGDHCETESESPVFANSACHILCRQDQHELLHAVVSQQLLKLLRGEPGRTLGRLPASTSFHQPIP